MTTFDQLDPVERRIDKSVTKMTSDDLISYIKTYMMALHNVDMAVDGIKERAIMTALKRIYKDDAGRLVKWVMSKYEGKDHKGQLVTFFSFQRSEKWWLDRLHTEMQVHQAAARSMEDVPQMTKLTDLRGRTRG